MHKKLPILAFLILIVNSFTLNAQGTFQKNLLDVSVWSDNLGAVGTIGGFVSNGGSTQNTIIWDTDPFGRKALVWKCISNGINSGNGGWAYSNIPVNDKKAYRLTVWTKKINVSTSGNLYLGCGGTGIQSLGGVDNTNPYFGYIPNNDPRLLVGKWYLWVGYIHASNDVDVQSYGGIYDGVTGQKVISLTDFKLKTSATMQMYRAFDFYDLTVGAATHWYGPRFEEINGAEPTIEQLLGVTGQGATLGNNAYLGGKLSIGTIKSSDANYKLFVETGIRTRKVKVDQDTWSDFVFEKDYALPTLGEVEKHIKEYKRLPQLPSAKEIISEGLDLGEINKKLLQKIEELTLYLIEQNKRLEAMEEKLEMSEQRVNGLKPGTPNQPGNTMQEKRK